MTRMCLHCYGCVCFCAFHKRQLILLMPTFAVASSQRSFLYFLTLTQSSAFLSITRHSIHDWHCILKVPKSLSLCLQASAQTCDSTFHIFFCEKCLPFLAGCNVGDYNGMVFVLPILGFVYFRLWTTQSVQVWMGMTWIWKLQLEMVSLDYVSHKRQLWQLPAKL